MRSCLPSGYGHSAETVSRPLMGCWRPQASFPRHVSIHGFGSLYVALGTASGQASRSFVRLVTPSARPISTLCHRLLPQACLQLDQTARPTAKECFAIIKRSLREGSDEPHSVGSGVPSVVVRYGYTDTSSPCRPLRSNADRGAWLRILPASSEHDMG